MIKIFFKKFNSSKVRIITTANCYIYNIKYNIHICMYIYNVRLDGPDFYYFLRGTKHFSGQALEKAANTVT